jgi:predicted ArsR family transcriptional regulator
VTSSRAQPVHDPTVLRGLAHPMRSRILDEMAATGPTRAADIARDLGIPANQASFHLRQLAKYGLVEEAVGAGRDRRDRVWKLVAEEGLSLNMGELEKAPGGKAAVSVFRRQAAARAHDVVDAAYSSERHEGALQTVTDASLKLTKAEAEQFASELDEVLQRWSAKTRGRDSSRRTYHLFSILQPYPEERREG